MLYRYQQHPPPDQSGPPPGPNGQAPGGPPAQPPRILVRMPVSPPHLTYVLLAINILVFLYMLSVPDKQAFFEQWGNLSQPIIDGEYYRLFTSMFVHANEVHIAVNGYALYLLGRLVESLFGTRRFAIIYFLGGLSGSLASFIFSNPAIPSVGASGAISAVFGAAIVYFYHHRHLHGQVGRQQLQQLVFFMFLNLALGFSSSSIDNAAHIGGFVGGFILAWFIGPAYVVKPDADSRGLAVVDENPLERWILPSVLYTVGLFAATLYAISNM